MLYAEIIDLVQLWPWPVLGVEMTGLGLEVWVRVRGNTALALRDGLGLGGTRPWP